MKHLNGYHFHVCWIICNSLKNSESVVKLGQQMLQKAQNLTSSHSDELTIIEFEIFLKVILLNLME